MTRDPQPIGARTAARRLLPDPGANARVNKLADLAARIVGAQRAEISLATDEFALIGSAGTRQPSVHQVCDQVLLAATIHRGRSLIVPDANADDNARAASAVASGEVGAFVSVPLRTEARDLVGALCVYDAVPHEWTSLDVSHLDAVAAAVTAELELAALAREFDTGRARWDAAVEASELGCYDWNLRTGQLVWDDALVRLFGFHADERFDETIQSFNDRVHPDDLARVTQERQTAIDRLGVYEAEYRVVLPGGDVRRLQSRGRAFGDSEGRPVRFTGAAWDVTVSRNRDETASAIIEAMPVGYLTVDREWRVRTLNVAGEHLLQVRRGQLIGQYLWDALPETVGTEFERLYQRGVDGWSDETGESFEAFYPAPVSAWLEVRTEGNDAGLAMYMTDVSDRRIAQEAAAEAAERDRTAAIALQQAMLTKLPQPDHLELAARYITAAKGHQVGGDWYDAIIQPGGSTVAIVGDVGGHDIQAAAVMGQLRSMLRGFVWDKGDSPAAALARLDHAMVDLRFETLATCVVARIEQTADQERDDLHTVRWSNAGNMPPIVIEPDGNVHVLERRPDLLLGIDATDARSDHTTVLAPGSTLVLYTDGLVETRTHSLDERLEQLVHVAGEFGTSTVDELLDGLVERMIGTRGEDDVVVLALRMHPHE